MTVQNGKMPALANEFEAATMAPEAEETLPPVAVGSHRNERWIALNLDALPKWMRIVLRGSRSHEQNENVFRLAPMEARFPLFRQRWRALALAGTLVPVNFKFRPESKDMGKVAINPTERPLALTGELIEAANAALKGA